MQVLEKGRLFGVKLGFRVQTPDTQTTVPFCKDGPRHVHFASPVPQVGHIREPLPLGDS